MSRAISCVGLTASMFLNLPMWLICKVNEQDIGTLRDTAEKILDQDTSTATLAFTLGTIIWLFVVFVLFFMLLCLHALLSVV